MDSARFHPCAQHDRSGSNGSPRVQSDADSDNIMQLICGARNFKLLIHALELGIFDEIEASGGSLSCEVLAAKLQIKNVDAAPRFFDALCSLGLLHKMLSKGRTLYSNRPGTSKYLTRSRKPTMVGLAMMENNFLLPMVDMLPGILKSNGDTPDTKIMAPKSGINMSKIVSVASDCPPLQSLSKIEKMNNEKNINKENTARVIQIEQPINGCNSRKMPPELMANHTKSMPMKMQQQTSDSIRDHMKMSSGMDDPMKMMKSMMNGPMKMPPGMDDPMKMMKGMMNGPMKMPPGIMDGSMKMPGMDMDMSASAMMQMMEQKAAEMQMKFLTCMDGLSMPCAPAILRSLDLKSHKKLVDLGGGSGSMAIQLAHAYPDMDVTVFDLQHVTQMAMKMQSNLPERLTFTSGNFFEDAIPDADVYVLSHVIHDWDDVKVDVLLERVYRKLPPGGSLVILEKCLNEARDSPVFAVVNNLMMSIISNGRERSESEYRDLLGNHGFVNTHITRISGYNYNDVIFTKKPMLDL